jgi:glycerol-3-phosphate acyltransferase PlsX
VANAVAVTARLLEENLIERIAADLAQLGGNGFGLAAKAAE